MLGREHEADLAREACNWRRAAEVRAHRRAAVRNLVRQRTPLQLVLARLVASLGVLARVEPTDER